MLIININMDNNNEDFIISLAQEIETIVAKDMYELPFSINVIDSAARGRLKEIAHSMVLAGILTYPEFQNSFLTNFLGISVSKPMKVIIEVPTKNNEVSKALDKNDPDWKIDILLYDDSHYIILENKVNDAKETPYQIYKYVYGSDRLSKHDISQVYVVYLNNLDNAFPSEQSYCFNGVNVREQLGARFIVSSFRQDIYAWIASISKDIKPDVEPHIYSALDQYIDYLESKFKLSTKYKKMNEDIKGYLFSKYNLENADNKEKIQSLNDALNQVKSLSERINNVITSLYEEESNKSMKDCQNQFEKNYPNVSIGHDEHSFGFKLKNDIWCGVWDSHYISEAKDQPVWAFQTKNVNDTKKSDVKKILEKSNMESMAHSDKKGWIAWGSSQHIFDKISKLFNSAKALNLIE